MLSELPTFALIGQRYLDTRHHAEYIGQLESELARRGVVGPKRAVLEYVAASGLWWNMLWWEWVALDGRGVLVGWISNLAVFATAAGIAGYFGGAAAAPLAVLAVHALTVWIGFDLRQGTKPDKART